MPEAPFDGVFGWLVEFGEDRVFILKSMDFVDE